MIVLLLLLLLLVVLLAEASASVLNGLDVARAPFSLQQGNISVWLSAAAFCGVETYQSRIFLGPTTGFSVTLPINNSHTDTQGFVGILLSDKSIYVTFRGSESNRDIITDLDAIKTDYTSFPECNCKVHRGFLKAAQSVQGDVLREVRRLRILHPDFAVKVTGHSLGAAVAQLVSMDLFKAGFEDVTVYNFGQPRTGDAAYAAFASERVSTWRVTHHRDSVPHAPFRQMGFQHICQEQYEDESGNFKSCDTRNCEDPTCAGQFDELRQLSSEDHMHYLGLYLSCAAVSAMS